MDARLLGVLCDMYVGSGFCEEPITRSEES